MAEATEALPEELLKKEEEAAADSEAELRGEPLPLPQALLPGDRLAMEVVAEAEKVPLTVGEMLAAPAELPRALGVEELLDLIELLLEPLLH